MPPAMPFNSVAGIERSPDGRTNPMVNAGAIATTSLVPGTTLDAKWKFIHDGLSQFAGRKLPMNEEVSALRLGDQLPQSEHRAVPAQRRTASIAIRWRRPTSTPGNAR